MINKALFIFLIFSLLNLPSGFAQSEQDSLVVDSASTLAQDSKHFIEVGLGLAVAPLQFRSGQWQGVGATAAGTALLFLADQPVNRFAGRSHCAFNDWVLGIDSFEGNHFTFLLSGGIYGLGYLTSNTHIRKMGLYAIEAFIYSGVISGIIKIALGRRRPYAGRSNTFFKPFHLFNSTYTSLPSGHTTVSFAVSSVLAESVDNIYWKTFWYGSAGLVGAARIYHNKHWLSDVFGGAVLGYAVGSYIVHFDRKEKPKLFGLKQRFYFSFNRVGLQVFL